MKAKGTRAVGLDLDESYVRALELYKIENGVSFKAQIQLALRDYYRKARRRGSRVPLPELPKLGMRRR